MKRAVLALSALVLVALALAANALLLSPRRAARAEVREQVAAARQEAETLRAALAQLRKLAADGTSRDAELARLGTLVPADPDISGLIRAMNDAAAAAGVEWSSLVPAPPRAGAGTAPTTIGLTIQLKGTFFQLMDYLRRIENLDRLVVIDSLDVNAAGGSGSPQLAVSMRARTFSASPAATAAGSTTPAQPATAAGASTAAAPAAGGSAAVPTGGR